MPDTPDTENRYARAWESFWGTLTGQSDEVLWNVPHELAVALDFQRFQDLISANQLPLVDMGCGDGTQTKFFGQYAEHVIGVDVSASAIEIARQQHSAPGVEYRVLDLLDDAACRGFHAEFGDVNIYMRGVLMQFLPEHRLLAVANLKTLIGSNGYLYMNEYVPETKAYYGAVFQRQGMPAGFSRVLQHGITPGGISAEDLQTFFPAGEYEFVRRGEHVMNTNIPLAEGGFIQAPAFYLVVKKSSSD